ncbi:MAG: NADH-quinone oxidoreductase subunit NuoK [Chloroflexi bacterium]|nr:NADH-quinone oxidoreductase subunit NuoK [Chloroflexota bacterium]
MSVGLNHYLVLSAFLFCIGLYGALSRRNAIIIMMCIEIMLNSVNIALVAFSHFIRAPLPAGQPFLTGQIFAIFIIVVAAAEAAVGLAIVISIYRSRETVDVSDINLLKM